MTYYSLAIRKIEQDSVRALDSNIIVLLSSTMVFELQGEDARHGRIALEGAILANAGKSTLN